MIKISMYLNSYLYNKMEECHRWLIMFQIRYTQKMNTLVFPIIYYFEKRNTDNFLNNASARAIFPSNYTHLHCLCHPNYLSQTDLLIQRKAN